MRMKILFTVSAAIFLLVSCAKQPEATISADKTTVETGETVKFSNTSKDGESYKWDFGDGSQSTDQSPSKSYATAGTYNVKMTAFSKKEKESDDASVSLTVKNINEKFAGNYNMSGICNGAYTLLVTAQGATNLQLANFVGYFTLNATVSGSTLTIPSQQFTTSDGVYQFSGTGTLNGSNLSLTVNYVYVDNVDPNNDDSGTCTDSGNK